MTMEYPGNDDTGQSWGLPPGDREPYHKTPSKATKEFRERLHALGLSPEEIDEAVAAVADRVEELRSARLAHAGLLQDRGDDADTGSAGWPPGVKRGGSLVAGAAAMAGAVAAGVAVFGGGDSSHAEQGG